MNGVWLLLVLGCASADALSNDALGGTSLVQRALQVRRQTANTSTISNAMLAQHLVKLASNRSIANMFKDSAKRQLFFTIIHQVQRQQTGSQRLGAFPHDLVRTDFPTRACFLWVMNTAVAATSVMNNIRAADTCHGPDNSSDPAQDRKRCAFIHTLYTVGDIASSVAAFTEVDTSCGYPLFQQLNDCGNEPGDDRPVKLPWGGELPSPSDENLPTSLLNLFGLLLGMLAEVMQLLPTGDTAPCRSANDKVPIEGNWQLAVGSILGVAIDAYDTFEIATTLKDSKEWLGFCEGASNTLGGVIAGVFEGFKSFKEPSAARACHAVMWQLAAKVPELIGSYCGYNACKEGFERHRLKSSR